MIAVLKPGTSPERAEHLIRWLKEQGLDVHISKGAYQTVLGLIGNTDKIDMDMIQSLDIVEAVTRVSDPFKAVNRKFHPEDTTVSIGDAKIGGGHFALIAGPCSVETESQIIGVAKDVKAAGASFLRGGAFKPRTSPYDFQGLGAEGIRLLLEAKKATDLPIVTEIMDIRNLPLFEDVDVIQVGARNAQNFDMLKMILAASSNENSLILDCFSGSGTTLAAAEKLQRKWIGIDSSDVAMEIAEKRLQSMYGLFSPGHRKYTFRRTEVSPVVLQFTEEIVS